MAKVLLIEDDLVVASTVQDWLESQKHMVEVAESGQDGLQMLCSYGFDVAIIDWELPDLNGVDVVRKFRQHGGLTPIIMLTGRQQIDDKEAGLDSGADDYLTKPFEMRELGARLRALLRRNSLSKSSVVAFGSIELDTVAGKVLSGNGEIELRPKEFALLEFLIHNPDRVLSTEEIIDRLWSAEEEGVVDSLRSHITRLRKKIESADSHVTIESVYGRGYRLVTK